MTDKLAALTRELAATRDIHRRRTPWHAGADKRLTAEQDYRKAAADLVNAYVDEITGPHLDAARTDARLIGRLESELELARQALDGLTPAQALALRDEVTELREKLLSHVCQPATTPAGRLPKRVSAARTRLVPEWSDAAAVPATAPQVATDGPVRPVAARKPRPASRAKGGSSQAVTEAPGGAA